MVTRAAGDGDNMVLIRVAQVAGEALALVRQAKRRAPNACVIVISENANAEVTVAAHRAGATAVLPPRRATGEALALIAKYFQPHAPIESLAEPARAEP